MSKDFVYRWGILPLWLLLTATIFFRTPIPIDETRYLSVAWEMWLRGDFLVPYLNGNTYSHKPPLLFWLMQVGWAIFGVNEWWPRLVGPLCALVNLLLVRKLAAKLWPEQTTVALMVPWILIATLLWTLFATSTMFDILLTGCVLLGMLGLVDAARGAMARGWAYVALAIGFGLLAKGPVVFLHLLPSALLMGLWSPQRQVSYPRWLACLLLAVLVGGLIALAWAIPAAKAGGERYAAEILWHQTADRTVGTQIHVRSWFWYLMFLPLFLFPWVFLPRFWCKLRSSRLAADSGLRFALLWLASAVIIFSLLPNKTVLFPWIYWPRFWRNLRRSWIETDPGLRFALLWLVSSFIIFSLLPSKQIHYLIPMMPAFAIMMARLLAGTEQTDGALWRELLVSGMFGLIGIFLVLLPWVPGLSKLSWVQSVEAEWGLGVLVIAVGLAGGTVYRRKLSVAMLSTALVSAVFIGFIFFFQYTGLAYNLRPAAMRVAAFNKYDVPYAFVGNYQGQLNFLGRLTRPVPVLQAGQLASWSKQHFDGYLISLEKEKPSEAFYLQPHREYWLVFRPAAQVARIKPLW